MRPYSIRQSGGMHVSLHHCLVGHEYNLDNVVEPSVGAHAIFNLGAVVLSLRLHQNLSRPVFSVEASDVAQTNKNINQDTNDKSPSQSHPR